MNYDNQLDTALNALHSEGRYRVFLDIRRKRGRFPYADWVQADGSTREIAVWCGNDYLGMGQNPVVLDAMHQAMNDAGFPFGVVFIEVGADLIDVSVGIGLGACSMDCRIARTLGGPGGGLFAGVE